MMEAISTSETYSSLWYASPPACIPPRNASQKTGKATVTVWQDQYDLHESHPWAT
jgi:hypothetical protein